MRIFITTRRLFVLAFALLLLTNIVVLAGVAYNRSAEPDARVGLTERELELSLSQEDENSGIALRLVWRVADDRENDQYYLASRPWQTSFYRRNPKWLDAEKLMTLGFDTHAIRSNGADPARRKINVPREIYVVLEYDGDAYRATLSRAEARVAKEKESLASKPQEETLQERLAKAEQWLAYERVEAPRLFAVDAGIDSAALRRQYSDSARFIIAKALVKAAYRSDCDNPRVIGYIKQISINSVNVPRRFRNAFAGMDELPYAGDDEAPRPPRYAVELAYGRRLEPWIEAVRVLNETR